MATTVYYRGIEFLSVQTREFDQTPQNDSSGTDQMFSRFRVTIDSLMSYDAAVAAVKRLGITGGSIAGGDVGQLLKTMEAVLGEHRGDFDYQINGSSVLSCTRNDDCDNGPKVLSVRATKFSQATIRVSFSIEIAKVVCTENPSPVLSNRWSCSDDIDADLVTTRHWRGRLRIARIDLNAHMFRGMCLPVLHRGWKRMRQNYMVDPSGLELAYEIEDRQMLGDAPPPFVVRMSGTHTEGVDMSGMTGKGMVSVRLDGPPYCDKLYLLQKAAQIIYLKAAINDHATGHYTDYTFTDHFGEGVNSVEARATFKRHATEGVSFGSLVTKTIGKKMADINLPGYEPGKAYTDGPYSTATIAGLFVCHLQSPCENNHEMPQAANQQPEDAQQSYGDTQQDSTISVAEGSISDSFLPVQSNSSHQQAIYTHAKVESHYDVSDGRVFLPVASSAGEQDADSLAAVRIHNRTAYRVVKVEMERLGEAPKLWKLADFDDANGIKHYLKTFKPNFRPPEQGGDGRIIYVADAEYVFALSRAPKESEKYSSGSLPWNEASPADNQYVLGTDPNGSGGLQ